MSGPAIDASSELLASQLPCPDGQHVDDGGPTCTRCHHVLPKVHQAVMARRKCAAVKRGRGRGSTLRCVRSTAHGGLHNDGAGRTWSTAPATPRKRTRKRKEKTRWQQLEVD